MNWMVTLTEPRHLDDNLLQWPAWMEAYLRVADLIGSCRDLIHGHVLYLKESSSQPVLYGYQCLTCCTCTDNLHYFRELMTNFGPSPCTYQS